MFGNYGTNPLKTIDYITYEKYKHEINLQTDSYIQKY